MRIAVLVAFAVRCVGVLGEITAGEELYSEAMSILGEQPDKYYGIAPLYTDENIEEDLYIPQYSEEKKNYEYDDGGPNSYTYRDVVYDVAFAKLEKAAEEGHMLANRALGEIYLFGNYSVKPDYLRSKEYFHRAADITGDGYSYFILGCMYSTGLFGTIDVDHAKANLYYQFGADNGNVNAMMAMGYRYLYGIGTPKNCGLAVLYYSRAAHIGISYIEDDDYEIDVLYNVRLYDFTGGLYGKKISETIGSVFFKTKEYNSSIEFIKEYDLYQDGHDFIKPYFKALEFIDGDYFIKKNYTLAAQSVQECVDMGERIYGANEYRSINSKIDRFFVSRCQALLGHMYLKGKGVEKDYDTAMHWISNSLRIENTSEALRDMGYIHEKGIPPLKKTDLKKAFSFYKRSLKVHAPSRESAVNLAKMLLKINNNDPLTSPKKEHIFNYTQEAAYNGSTEALYYLAEFYQSGLATAVDANKRYSCEKIATYYKYFMEHLEHLFITHLQYAFDEFRFGNVKNALIGYSIAAEQGLESSESTVAYLLYQPQPLYQLKEHKTYSTQRIKMAMRYLERASEQGNIDTTILLGDLYFYGNKKSELPPDYPKAFMYYMKAFQRHSSHGSYNLAYMYEYGYGPNNTVDYFLAKRYYDFSIKFMEEAGVKQSWSSVPINFSLLRLRIKYLFNKKSFKTQNNQENGGWLKAFKNLGKTNKDETSGNEQTSEAQDRESRKASAHHEGTSYFEPEEYEVEDYLVIISTLAIFLFFFIRNIRHQLRGDPVNRNDQNDNNQNNENLARFNFQGGNIEFHFFAL